MIITDLSDSLIKAAEKEFPKARVGHDYFHTSKLLNEALMKELLRYQWKLHDEINEFKKARRITIQAEKTSNLKKIESKIPILKKAMKIYVILFKMFNAADLNAFKKEWSRLKTKINEQKDVNMQEIIGGVEQNLPNCGFTEKNYHRFAKKACSKWRMVIKDHRSPFEKKKSTYSSSKSLILMNPSKMDDFERNELREFLSQYPYLRPIRKAVRKFHYQFKAPASSWRSLNFLKKIVDKDSHSKLKSAVKTLIKRQDHIFAYRKVLSEHPELRDEKSIRSNREELNVKVNKAARNQNGFRSLGNICKKVGGILDCPIIISSDLVPQGVNDL